MNNDWKSFARKVYEDGRLRASLFQEYPRDRLRRYCVSPESFTAILNLILACDDDLQCFLVDMCNNKFKAGYSETDVYMFLYNLGDES